MKPFPRIHTGSRRADGTPYIVIAELESNSVPLSWTLSSSRRSDGALGVDSSVGQTALGTAHADPLHVLGRPA